MAEGSDPYMINEDDDEDSDVSSGPLAKKHRKGFSETAAPTAAETDAEQDLEAMLRAAGEGFSQGMSAAGGGFSGGPGGFGGPPTGFGGPPMGGGKGMGKPPRPVDPNPVETTPMDFSKMNENVPAKEVPVPKDICECLMTPGNRQALTEESGAIVEWAPDTAQVLIRGSTDQEKRAMRLLQRVLMHCNWGKSEAKVKRLLKPRIVETAMCRLSPMNTLRPAEKTLSLSSPLMTIGKDKANDVVIQDGIISRSHCILELDAERGAVYALDVSTNGTFLNGLRLPPKTVGKVLLSHGDELLFKDPASGDQEFGYIVNITELVVKGDVKHQAPRRILSSEDSGTRGTDFA